MGILHVRTFSAAKARAHSQENPYIQELQGDAMDELFAQHHLYARDRQNVHTAASYFKELNRQGYFAQVQKLYMKNEVDYLYQVSKSGNPAYEQYQYAVENSDYLKKAFSEDNSSSWRSKFINVRFQTLGWTVKVVM